MLIHQVKTIRESASLGKEINCLKMIFRKNGYSNHNIKNAFFLRQGPHRQQEKMTGTVILPFQQFLTKSAGS
jgi:hypothetical protein